MLALKSYIPSDISFKRFKRKYMQLRVAMEDGHGKHAAAAALSGRSNRAVMDLLAVSARRFLYQDSLNQCFFKSYNLISQSSPASLGFFCTSLRDAPKRTAVSLGSTRWLHSASVSANGH